MKWINIFGDRLNIDKVALSARKQWHSGLYSGKSVAIVGPSGTIQGTKQRDFIESHDVVIRINTAIKAGMQIFLIDFSLFIGPGSILITSGFVEGFI